MSRQSLRLKFLSSHFKVGKGRRSNGVSDLCPSDRPLNQCAAQLRWQGDRLKGARGYLRPTLLKLQSFISLIQGTLRGNSQTKDYTEGRGPIYNTRGETGEYYLEGGREEIHLFVCMEGGSNCLYRVLSKTDTTNNCFVPRTANCVRPEYKEVLHRRITSIN